MTEHGSTKHTDCKILMTYMPKEIGSYSWDQLVFTLFSCGSVCVEVNDEYEAYYTKKEWTKLVKTMASSH